MAILLVLFLVFAFFVLVVGLAIWMSSRRIEPRGFDVLPPEDKDKPGGQR